MSKKRYPIICLCGSTRFKEQFLEFNRKLTLDGFIVLMPGVFNHCEDGITEEQKERLDELHKNKIAMSDMVIIVNPNNYIGDSTKKEIKYAGELNLPIFYTSELY